MGRPASARKRAAAAREFTASHPLTESVDQEGKITASHPLTESVDQEGKMLSSTPEKNHHAGAAGSTSKRYWELRHELWSKFDEGIQMDEEGWFSVTPVFKYKST